MNWEKHVGKGWRPIVKDAIDKLVAGGATITQVKEKFGGLRIYFYADDYTGLHEIVDEAEKKCDSICEFCGKPGKTISIQGWYKTVCEDHKNGDVEQR